MTSLPAELPDVDHAFGQEAVALVTGATSGIGLEVARQLIDRGLTVHIGARDVRKGRSIAKELGGAAHALQLDVTDAESIAAAARELPTLDILVNNAGVNPGNDDITAAGIEQFRTAYETNVFGLVAVTQAMLPLLNRSAHPRIVNISSGTGSLTWTSGPNPQFDWESVKGGGLAYRSSKTAVNALTLMTSQALGGRFKVNALAPGRRRTNLVPGITGGGDPAEAAAAAVRLALLPEDGPTGGMWSWDGSLVPW
ncbi:NADP-dependent 3-hydroxy acid dehydrogenase YdfG [Nakamurella panacisegetis]|uniref:NADP-dependent 3-hydroxy acid dehydrogenase YdfG n=1 Tax=Nakamurella panacisegetis TaxID=1090615 RepID=A0A1H0KJI0_9ACTN|nr:SDR family NAD(P)-dependent oxidoreductase [Nakamurella panacisegetis]SDO55891.1 NADP-dependent 3-hydroxy acid dehydrogenase YdfG [Nakamurella panacisegetis]